MKIDFMSEWNNPGECEAYLLDYIGNGSDSTPFDR